MRLHLFCFFLLSQMALGQSTASSQVSTFEISSPELGASRKIWIWLPKNYAESKSDYPVLYMHDAQNLFDAKTSFVGEWNVDETLESLDAQVIVVGIEHGNDKRIVELTPFPNSKYGGGNGNAYLDFIAKTLKPEIDKRYRTKTDRSNTAIMGSSLGGLISFYALVHYPKTFGKAGVFSPSFWFSDKIFESVQSASVSDIKNKKIYFLCGDSEDEQMVPDMKRMIDLVKTKHAVVTQLVVEGGQHNEKLWREHFAEAFKWLFARD